MNDRKWESKGARESAENGAWLSVDFMLIYAAQKEHQSRSFQVAAIRFISNSALN